MPELDPGTTFADHVIQDVAGKGGMGIVYRALHVPLNRQVALKVIAPEFSSDEEFRRRFQREFRAAASIQHPNVVPIYHAGEEDDLLYVTMRYVEGTDLARLLYEHGRLEPPVAARIVSQVAAALDAAHAGGIVHRDVKPANVLLDGDTALLTDFGLMKDLKSTSQITEARSLVGTFDYAAPEQLREDPVDARTDVYALGGVLFQTLTGKVPYPRETAAATMLAHIDSPPPSVLTVLPDASELLGEVVRRAMAKDPNARYPSAGDLGRAVLAAVDGRPPPEPERSVAAGQAAAARREAVPLPPALAVETGRRPFVGREPMLATLATRYAAAEDGERQFVLITGEPGIGKTRLATQLARRAHGAGATVLYGRSDPEALLPYQPFVTALRHFVAHREPLGAEPDSLSELARFIPELRGHDARAARRRAGAAPLPALRGRHAHARVDRARAARRAAARRPALGRRVDDAAAQPRAAASSDAAVRASGPRAASRASCSRACGREPWFERVAAHRAERGGDTRRSSRARTRARSSCAG